MKSDVNRSSFEASFGRTAAITTDAPGRVNLIGEHTDYSGGFVLPMAIPQRTTVALSPRDDDRVRVRSANVRDPVEATYLLGAEARAEAWFDYVQGVTHALRAAGHAIRGFDAHIDSRVPVGGGLSSSAALEVALLRALRGAFHLSLDDVALAIVARRAETELVGAPVGIMDPLASSLADEYSALFIDTRSLHIERVRLPDDVEVVVIDSGVAHGHAGGEYRTRRAEVERAAELLGVRELRAAEGELDRIEILPEPFRRRARHVVTENARVLAAVQALRAADATALGRLLVASHASLRDDFEVSVPEIDTLVARALAEPGVLGARLTGGGFGGAVIVLARAGEGYAIGTRVSQDIPSSRVLVPQGPRDRYGDRAALGSSS